MTLPWRNDCTSFFTASTIGARTLSRMLLFDQTVSLSTTVAPACVYASSGNCAASPAPRSTSTREKPFLSNKATLCGVMATRRSFGYVSHGMPTVREEYGTRAGRERLDAGLFVIVTEFGEARVWMVCSWDETENRTRT